MFSSRYFGDVRQLIDDVGCFPMISSWASDLIAKQAKYSPKHANKYLLLIQAIPSTKASYILL